MNLLSPPLNIFLTIILGIVLIVLVGLKESVRKNNYLLGSIGAVVSLLTLIETVQVLQMTLHYPITVWFTAQSPSTSCLIIDSFSAIMAVLFAFVTFVVAIYSLKYMEGRHALNAYYILLLVMLLSLIGIVYAGDFLTFFVFYESLSVSAISLVAYFKNEEAVEAAFKYLIMDATGSTLVLLGFALLYGVAGTLNIALATKQLYEMGSNLTKFFVITLLVCGFSFKAAIFPMHSWLIDAHPAAPSGISAMLSGVVIKSGVYAIIRLLVLSSGIRFELYDLLLIIGALTITIPNIIALAQDDVKRILAYSSIYNIGVILVGVATGTALGIAAAIFHMINHALFKAMMFMGAGIFVHEAGSRKLDDLSGIGRSMPIAGTIFGGGAIGLMGLPPFSTFFSKLLIVWAALSIDGYRGLIIAALVLVNSIISIGYYGRLIKYIIMKQPKEKKVTKESNYKELNEMIAALTLIFVAIIIVSIYPGIVLSYIQNATESLLNPSIYWAAVS
ncbi:MAG: complex I subunit 5 family protein [Candidatus Njordarchaeales archaeon]